MKDGHPAPHDRMNSKETGQGNKHGSGRWLHSCWAQQTEMCGILFWTSPLLRVLWVSCIVGFTAFIKLQNIPAMLFFKYLFCPSHFGGIEQLHGNLFTIKILFLLDHITMKVYKFIHLLLFFYFIYFETFSCELLYFHHFPFLPHSLKSFSAPIPS